MWSWVVQLFTQIEEEFPWPHVLHGTFTTLIMKGEGNCSGSGNCHGYQCPLSSVGPFVSPPLLPLRPPCQSKQASLRTRRGLGISVDRAKSFGLLRFDVCLALFRALGGLLEILVALSTFYASLERRLRWNDSVGPVWNPASGLLQGDGLSCTLCRCTFALWGRAVEKHVQSLMPCGYFDDAHFYSVESKQKDDWTSHQRRQGLVLLQCFTFRYRKS